MSTYYCVCYIQAEDDNIVIDANSETEAYRKAKQKFIEGLNNDFLRKIVRCECYTEKEVNDLMPFMDD